MNVDDLKTGDFITLVSDKGNDIVVARIIKFETYEGRRTCAEVLAFPGWNEWSSTTHHFAEMSDYYLKKARLSTDLEVAAWRLSAEEYDKEIIAKHLRIHKIRCCKINKKRVVPMDKLEKWEYERHPPVKDNKGNYFPNWLWQTLHRFKVWNPKTNKIATHVDID